MRATETQHGPPETPRPVHVIETRAEKWRFKCPNPPHHDDWRLWNGVFCCRSCQRLRDSGRREVETVFSELWDSKRGRTVPRECIKVEL